MLAPLLSLTGGVKHMYILTPHVIALTSITETIHQFIDKAVLQIQGNTTPRRIVPHVGFSSFRPDFTPKKYLGPTMNSGGLKATCRTAAPEMTMRSTAMTKHY